MRANLTSGSMRGDWRGANSPAQSPTLLYDTPRHLLTTGCGRLSGVVPLPRPEDALHVRHTWVVHRGNQDHSADQALTVSDDEAVSSTPFGDPRKHAN